MGGQLDYLFATISTATPKLSLGVPQRNQSPLVPDLCLGTHSPDAPHRRSARERTLSISAGEVDIVFFDGFA